MFIIITIITTTIIITIITTTIIIRVMTIITYQGVKYKCASHLVPAIIIIVELWFIMELWAKIFNLFAFIIAIFIRGLSIKFYNLSYVIVIFVKK